MSPLIKESLQYALIPAMTVLVGGLLAFIKTPSKKVSSFTQHFAAGVVFAAVALELLPKLSETHNNWALCIGFILGVILMIGIKEMTGGHEHGHGEAPRKQLPWNLLIAIGVDLFIDGLLIGIAMVAGEKGGFLIAIALGIEILFLGISLTASISQRKFGIGLGLSVLLIMAIIILLGALLGSSVISHASDFTLEAILAFGVAALLYLVTEELLEEAHETKDTPVTVSAFFAGFLIIYLLNQQL